MTTQGRYARGFTLLETMFAMAILAIALLGAFGAFVHVSGELREGQLRQYKNLLAQAWIERLRFADRTALFATTTPNPGAVRVELLPASPGGWTMDSSAQVTDDWGTGALFTVLPNGTIQPQSMTVLSCSDPAIPDGTYCREILVHQGVPGTALNAPISGVLPGLLSTAVTVWVRVFRKGEDVGKAAVQNQVMVQ